MAVILKLTPATENIFKNAILSGDLVAFPTETVFGLGANIFDERALEKIFEAKGRPKSDPLIVHIVSLEGIEKIIDIKSDVKCSFDVLSNKFWPGPLTLVVNASENLSRIVTAGGDYVGLRMPSNIIARNFLKNVGVPLAAPSANRFGHVSPTNAQHVYDDLGDYPGLLILDPPQQEPCDVGFESTVAKIMDNGDIVILRQGAIGSIEIQKALREKKLKNNVTLNSLKNKETNNTHITDSPGQMLTHYSPMIESFVISKVSFDEKDLLKNTFDKQDLKACVVIDFQREFIGLKKFVLRYVDLSPEGNIMEAGRNLFSCLRTAENVKDAKYILMTGLYPHDDELKSALFDRIYRAASGKCAQISFLSE